MLSRPNDWNGGFFRDLEALQREVNRSFENIDFGGWTRPFSRFSFLPGVRARVYPLVNLSEDGDAIYAEAMAPGVDPGTLNVQVLRDQLTISGEKTRSEEIKPEAYHRYERAIGKFTRTIRVPSEVDSDKVTAEYANGLLRITMPKAEASKPRQITVSTS